VYKQSYGEGKAKLQYSIIKYPRGNTRNINSVKTFSSQKKKIEKKSKIAHSPKHQLLHQLQLGKKLCAITGHRCLGHLLPAFKLRLFFPLSSDPTSIPQKPS